MKYTMKDIAQAAGVSLSTVSLVLNDRPVRVSDKTRKRIKQIAAETHYQPNSAAVSLSRHVSYNIGLIVPDITNPFFAQMTREINEQLAQHGYSTLFADSNNSAEKERHILHNMVSRGVDGILLVPSNEFFYQDMEKLQKQIDETGKPFVLVNATADKLKVCSVNFDNFQGAALATQELIDHGHRNIAFIQGKARYVNAPERYQGYRQTLEKNGLTFHPDFLYEGDYSIESGYQAASSIINNNEVTAVLSSSDMMLFGIIKWANEHQVNAFNRFSMIGFDNDPYDVITQYPLTTVDQQISKMVSESVGALLKMIVDKKITHQKLIVTPELIRRQSVRMIKK